MAANRLFEIEGGIILVENGRIIYEMPLELGGVMSCNHFDVTVERIRELIDLLCERGYKYNDLLYSLLFLSVDFLPELRVTNAGVYDVKTQETLRPRRGLR